MSIKRLNMSDKTKVIDWIRGFGQEKIDSEKLNLPALADMASAIVGLRVTVSMMAVLLDAAGMRAVNLRNSRQESLSEKIRQLAVRLDEAESKIKKLEHMIYFN